MTQQQRYLAESAIAALVGVALAVTGAFGTGDLPLAMRFLYWIGGLLAAGLVLQGLLWATRPLAELLRLPEYAPYLIATPLLAVLIFLALDMFGGASGALPLLLYTQILGLGLGFFILFGALYWYSGKKHGEGHASSSHGERFSSAAPRDRNAVPQGLDDTPLHERLRPGFGPILAIGVEDHYAKIYAAGDSEMLLMNLSDAIALMPPEGGLQVHRSWWVARHAVLRARRNGRNLSLVLHGDRVVPVSRANHAVIREAGWL